MDSLRNATIRRDKNLIIQNMFSYKLKFIYIYIYIFYQCICIYLHKILIYS